MPTPKYNHPFIKHVRHECKRYNIKFKLLHQSEIIDPDNGSTCGGYFSDDPLELVVATKLMYTDFLSTLVHEYSHFEQWRDKSPYYFHDGYKGLYSGYVMDRWLSGHEYKTKTIKKCIDIIRDCELDCDRIAIKNINKYKIPINVEKYCKFSSAYIHFFNFIKRSRQWEYKKSLGEIKPLIKAMPNNLDGNYSNIPKKILDLYKKHMR